MAAGQHPLLRMPALQRRGHLSVPAIDCGQAPRAPQLLHLLLQGGDLCILLLAAGRVCIHGLLQPALILLQLLQPGLRRQRSGHRHPLRLLQPLHIAPQLLGLAAGVERERGNTGREE